MVPSPFPFSLCSCIGTVTRQSFVNSWLIRSFCVCSRQKDLLKKVFFISARFNNDIAYSVAVPKFKVRLDHNITMFQNKSVIFKCRLNSKKIQVNITWFKDERPVNRMFPSYKVTSYRWGSKLKIRRAKTKDAGIFECRAKGPGGIVTARAWLKINGQLNTPPLPGRYIFFPRSYVPMRDWYWPHVRYQKMVGNSI